MSCSAEPTRLHPPLPVQHAVLGGLLYLDILFVLKPSLLFHDQSPAFIATWRAFAERAMDWPGGLVEYLAAALTQAYLIPWLGAGVLMAMIALPCLLTDRLMRIGGARPGHFWAWVPAICLLALAHRFVLPFSVILAACIAVAGTLFFYRVTQQWKTPTATNAGIHPVVRLAIAFPLFCVIYAVAGGAMLLAVGLCGLIEIVVRRSPITGILALLAGVCIPEVAAIWIYQIGLREAMLRLTTIEFDYRVPLASIAFYGSVLLAIPIARGWITKPFRRFRQPRNTPPREAAWVGWGKVVCIALAATAMVSFLSDAKYKAALTVDYYTRQRQWPQALEAARPFRWAGVVPGQAVEEKLARLCHWYGFPTSACTSVSILPSYDAIIHDINFALAQNGQLLDDMFSYPQIMGASVLSLQPDAMGPYVAHSYNTDLLLELGHLNEAQRVACESLANIGPRPWLLERLAIICVLKGQCNAARSFLKVMATMPAHRRFAQASLDQLAADPLWSVRPEMKRIRERMFKEDHVGVLDNMHPDEDTLRHLLMANPHNRLAFDYIMAHYLLNLRVDQVVRYVRYLGEFGYQRIPRHCEEAILFHMRATQQNPELGGFQIRPETIRRFEAFQRILNGMGGPSGPNRLKIRDALVGEFGDTYWFYALFGNTFFGYSRSTVSASEPTP